MPGTDTYLGLRAFVDELVRCGLRDACTSPGSRSTPLVTALTRDGRLRATSHVDERCALPTGRLAGPVVEGQAVDDDPARLERRPESAIMSAAWRR